MKGMLSAFGVLALEMLAAAGILLLLAGGLCLLGRQLTLGSFAAMAQDIGFLALGIGALTLMGAAGIARNAYYQIARTASAGNILQRAQQDVTDSNRRLRFMIAVKGGGLLALVAGLLTSASVAH